MLACCAGEGSVAFIRPDGGGLNEEVAGKGVSSDAGRGEGLFYCCVDIPHVIAAVPEHRIWANLVGKAGNGRAGISI